MEQLIAPAGSPGARTIAKTRSAPAQAARDYKRTLKAERRARYEDRLLDVLTSPAVLRTVMVAGIVAYSTNVCRSDQKAGPVQTALAFALPSIGIPLIAADAGIKDKYALLALSAIGLGYVTEQAGVGLVDAYGGGGGLRSWAEAIAMVPRMMGIPIPDLE